MQIMRNLRTALLAALACGLALAFLALPVSAQTSLTSTTLAAAITNANDQNMTIASTTGWTATSASAQTYALIDSEVVGVRSLNTTTKIVGITRGLYGTRATGHASGTKVYFIPAGSVTLGTYDRAGACATGGSSDSTQDGSNVPVLNVQTRRLFTCANSVWVQYAYEAGAGATCTVTQQTNRTTGVTCQGLSGTITTNNASLAAENAAEFTVTNAALAAGDVVVTSIQSGTNSGNTDVYVSTVAAGSFKIKVANNNVAAGTAETGAILINFVVMKSQP